MAKEGERTDLQTHAKKSWDWVGVYFLLWIITNYCQQPHTQRVYYELYRGAGEGTS